MDLRVADPLNILDVEAELANVADDLRRGVEGAVDQHVTSRRREQDARDPVSAAVVRLPKMGKAPAGRSLPHTWGRMRRFGRGRGAPQERQTSRRARSGKLCSTLFSWVTCSSRTLLAFQGKSVVHKSCFQAGEDHGLRLRSPLERGWFGFSVAAPIGPIGPTLGALVIIVQRSDLEKTDSSSRV